VENHRQRIVAQIFQSQVVALLAKFMFFLFSLSEVAVHCVSERCETSLWEKRNKRRCIHLYVSYYIKWLLYCEKPFIRALLFYYFKTFNLHNCSWLRHCATSRNVAGSIPDGVIGTFRLHNPSGRTMTLGSTQSLTEMSTRNISWGVEAAGA
jgi:hypothetical protein